MRRDNYGEKRREPRKKKHQSGQGLIEFAFAVPIFLMMVFGIIDVARVLFSYVQVSNASRQAIRYGIVDGLEAASHQYLNCAGIRGAALELPGLLTLSNDDVDVYYEDATGTKITDCVDGLTILDVNAGDVLVVNVNAEVPVLTPVLMAFTDKFEFYYTTRRTIVNGIASTEDWSSTDPPDTATHFDATVDCTGGSNNVSFTWDPMSPIPERAEIRDAITGLVVAYMDDTEPGLIDEAFCNNCATISNNDGFGMYFLVAYNGTYPDEISGIPSNTDVAMCQATAGAVAHIGGYVFDDKDGDGVDPGPSEQGIENVRMYVYGEGADGILGNDDDTMHSQLTDSDGYFAFYNLSLQNYRIDVGESSPPVRGDIVTTGNDPFFATLVADVTGDSEPDLCGPGIDGIPGNGDEVCGAGTDLTVGTADDDIIIAVIIGFDDPP